MQASQALLEHVHVRVRPDHEARDGRIAAEVRVDRALQLKLHPRGQHEHRLPHIIHLARHLFSSA